MIAKNGKMESRNAQTWVRSEKSTVYLEKAARGQNYLNIDCKNEWTSNWKMWKILQKPKWGRPQRWMQKRTKLYICKDSNWWSYITILWMRQRQLKWRSMTRTRKAKPTGVAPPQQPKASTQLGLQRNCQAAQRSHLKLWLATMLMK